MLSEVSYAAFANYSPRGSSEIAEKSKRFCARVKNGEPRAIKAAIERLDLDLFQPFLNPEVTLLPIPRSSPLKEDALWPSKVITDLLMEENLGKEVRTFLHRVKAVPKSSGQFTAATRPTIEAHLESLAVLPEVGLNPEHITLVDDVITLGRTGYACAQKIHEAFPNAEIRIFTLIKTKGLEPDIDEIIDPCISTLTFNNTTRKVRRSDDC